MTFRSGLEEKVALQLLGWSYEPLQLEYKIARKYTPDFCYADVVVECKGFFRTGDIAKYKAIHEELKSRDMRFVFILDNPRTKVRKGAKMDMAGWCDKEGIPWFTLDTLEELKAYVHSE